MCFSVVIACLPNNETQVNIVKASEGVNIYPRHAIA